MNYPAIVGNETPQVQYNPAWSPAERDARFGRMMAAGYMYFTRVAEPFAREMTPEGMLRQIVADQPAIKQAIEGAISAARDFAALVNADYQAGRYGEAFRKASVYLANAVQLDSMLSRAVPASLGIWQAIPYNVAMSMIRDVQELVRPNPPGFPWFKVAIFGVGAFAVYRLVKSDGD